MKTVKLTQNNCGGRRKGCHFPVIYLPQMKKAA